MAYIGLSKEKATEGYKFELLMWKIGSAWGGSSKPPAPPEILRPPKARRIRAGVKEETQQQ